MRKLIAIIFWLFSSLAAISQTTAVTATITDSDSTVWINPQWSVQFVPNPNFPQLSSYSIGGVPITSNTYSQYIQVSGTGNGSGVISTTLLDNGQVLPAGSTYRFVIQSQTSAPATTYTPVKVTGASQSLTSYLSSSSIAPRFPATQQAFGYADAEISTIPQPGGYYYNVVNSIQRVWNGSTWTNSGGGGGGGSQKVIYTSSLTGAHGGVAVIPGSSATSTTDSATAINTVLASGNVDLEVDSGYALSTSLVLSSNTTIHCIVPQYGFIMQAAANTPVLINAHTNAPTTTNSTNGYVVSNIGDNNIVVTGCQLNANSTQAVTGVSNLGTPHSATPGGFPTAKFVGGVEFYAVNGLTYNNNECYDSGTWCFFASNVEYVHITNNYFHQPTPIVASKNTGGYQIDGPAQFIYASHNRISAGDDSIAYVADDGQYPGTGEPAATYIKSFVKWGNLTDVVDSNEILDNTFYGVRLLSVTDLEDRIFISNITGTICGNTGTLTDFWPNLGPGNLGTIRFDGWNLATNGSCNTFNLPNNFELSSNIQSLQLSGIQITNPGANWPMINQVNGNIGILSLRDWDLNTQSSSFSNVIHTTGGTIGQLSVSGIQWYDNPTNTGSFFSGSAVPAILTCSNYSGPNRLLAAGYIPAIQNGDCFTNTYSTTYLSTTFNEGSAAAAIVGTSPAICSSGCTGTWIAAANYPTSNPWQFVPPGAIGAGACTSGVTYCPAVINVGHTTYTLRASITDSLLNADSFNFAIAWTNAANHVWIGCSAGVWDLYDIVAGSANLITTGGACTNGTSNITIAKVGNVVTVTVPSGQFSGTVSGSNTGTNIGFANFGTGTTLRFTVNSLSVKSN